MEKHPLAIGEGPFGWLKGKGKKRRPPYPYKPPKGVPAVNDPIFEIFLPPTVRIARLPTIPPKLQTALNDTFAFGPKSTRFLVGSARQSRSYTERLMGIEDVEKEYGNLRKRLVCEGLTGLQPNKFSVKDLWTAQIIIGTRIEKLVRMLDWAQENVGAQPLFIQDLSWSTFEEPVPAVLQHSQHIGDKELLEQLTLAAGQVEGPDRISFMEAVVQCYRDEVRALPAMSGDYFNDDFKKSADFSDSTIKSAIRFTFWGSDTRSCLTLSHPNLYGGIADETKILLDNRVLEVYQSSEDE